MDTLHRLHDTISAMADGELAECDAELALAALAGADGHATWRIYHLIGDLLRAQADGALSAAFHARLTARLALEPAPAGRVRAGRGKAVPADENAAATPASTADLPMPLP
ncbi:MAG: RseA family anti-sigma factor [Pseudomonadota bacterium]